MCEPPRRFAASLLSGSQTVSLRCLNICFLIRVSGCSFFAGKVVSLPLSLLSFSVLILIEGDISLFLSHREHSVLLDVVWRPIVPQ